MKRTTLYMLILTGSAASALAAVGPKHFPSHDVAPAAQETVIEKNQAYPLIGPLTVEECVDSACSVTLN